MNKLLIGWVASIIFIGLIGYWIGYAGGAEDAREQYSDTIAELDTLDAETRELAEELHGHAVIYKSAFMETAHLLDACQNNEPYSFDRLERILSIK